MYEENSCVACGSRLRDQVCEACRLLWGVQKLPQELEGFLAFAHNAKLEPDRLIELESLLATLPRIKVSPSKSQQAKREGLTFNEPALEKLRRLKSLLRYNRRFVTPEQPITERDLHKVTQAVKRAYRLALEVLQSIGSLRCHRVDSNLYRSLIAIPCFDESDQEERKAFEVEEVRLAELRSDRADQIDAILLKLEESADEMREAVKPLSDLLLDLLPCSLDTVDLDKGISGFHSFYPIDCHWRYMASDWGHKHSSLLRRKVSFGQSGKIEQLLKEEFPISEEDHGKLFKRIRVEQSTVLAKLKGYIEQHREAPKETTSQIDLSNIQSIVEATVATIANPNRTGRKEKLDIEAMYDKLSDAQQDEIWHFIDFKNFKNKRKNKTQEFLESRKDLENYDCDGFRELMDRIRQLEIYKADPELRKLSALRRKILEKSQADD